jgi:hypothetical protein
VILDNQAPDIGLLDVTLPPAGGFDVASDEYLPLTGDEFRILQLLVRSAERLVTLGEITRKAVDYS